MSFRKIIPLLIGMLMVALFCTCAASCARGSTSIDVMKKVPVDSASLDYWEVRTLGTDDALLDIYDKFKDSDEIEQLREVGVTRADVNQIARASGFGQATVTILTGKFDIEGIKSELDGREDYVSDAYQKAIIWTPEDTQINQSIAVRDNIILMGDKDDIIKCIDTIALEQQRNLYEDRNIISVISRLPDGILIQVKKAVTDPEEDYTDLIAYGKSYVKEGEGELKLTAVYMFEDYSAANTEAQDGIRAYLSNKGFRDIKVERYDQKFLRATAVIYIDVFVDILAW